MIPGIRGRMAETGNLPRRENNRQKTGETRQHKERLRKKKADHKAAGGKEEYA